MPRNVKTPLTGCFVCVGGLAVVALLAYGSESAQRLDRSIRDWFVADPGSRAHSVATAVAHLGDPLTFVLFAALACAIGFLRGQRREAVAALAVVAGANLTTQLLKVLVSHPRFRSLLGAEQFTWDGFPSGHTTAVASIAIAFAFVLSASLRPVIAVIGACLAVAVGCSMVVLHRHFPSDVVGGVFVAGAWGFGVLAAMRAIARTTPPRGTQLPKRAAISLK